MSDRPSGDYWVWIGSVLHGRRTLTIGHYDPQHPSDPQLTKHPYPWTVVGCDDTLAESEVFVAGGPLDVPHFCVMLTGHSTADPTPDVECAKVATHYGPERSGRPVTHYCCADCYEEMRQHDPDLLRDYRPVRELDFVMSGRRDWETELLQAVDACSREVGIHLTKTGNEACEALGNVMRDRWEHLHRAPPEPPSAQASSPELDL